ncbi:MAG: UPF0758 domain-containing protein, partial [Bacteroidales bacterium]
MAIKTESEYNLPMCKWALEDRPREKMLNQNASNLTDAELLAIIIGTGTKSRSALDLSRYILQSVNHDVNEL